MQLEQKEILTKRLPETFLSFVTHFELILRTAQNPRIAVTSFMRKHIRDFYI